MKYSSFAKSYVFLGDSPFCPRSGTEEREEDTKTLENKGYFLKKLDSHCRH